MLRLHLLFVLLGVCKVLGQKVEAEDVVVADAQFSGVYVGIVRMVQVVTNDESGAPNTSVTVRVGHAANDSTTDHHMWHVEHDPITGELCAETNRHFAPLGITKGTNYTQYCSSYTPEYCEIGDISTKTTLTSVGKGVMNTYDVPLLPVVGPYTVIGHSVNIHGGNKSKKRQACANIELNRRATKAKFFEVNVKVPDSKDMALVDEARRKMAQELGIPVSKIHTAGGLNDLNSGCTTIEFLLFDRNIKYCDKILSQLQTGKRDIGSLTPVGCVVDGATVTQPEATDPVCKKQMNNGGGGAK